MKPIFFPAFVAWVLGLSVALGALPDGEESEAARLRPLIQEAESSAAMGQHAQAAKALEQALQVAPEQESLRFRLASQYVFLKRFAAAKTEYLKVVAAANPALAALAQNAIDTLDVKRKTEATTAAREAAFQRKSAAMKQEQARRERAYRAKEADLQARQAIYELFESGQDRKGLAEWDAYGKKDGSPRVLPMDLELSAVYALQRLGEFSAARDRLAAMSSASRSTPQWLLAEARNQMALGHQTAAWEALAAAKAASRGTPLSQEVDKEIAALPAQANLDRWTWGELQLDTVYLSRFNDTIFYGQIREGLFLPGARWIQPYIQLDTTMDTQSGGTAGLSQVYANNLAGAHVGVRIRLIPNEEIWLYGLMGVAKDLRGTTRFEGAWFLDLQAGFKGYKGFGPGLNFLRNSTFFQPTTPRWMLRPRLAWLAEGGWDAAYYSLYENFIAYGQMREGFRVLEMGGWAALDAYAVQQATVDSLGLYYNNFGELGGGLRVTLRLQPSTSLVCRVEYLGGAYLGVAAEDSRGTLPENYGDLRISLSLWSEW